MILDAILGLYSFPDVLVTIDLTVDGVDGPKSRFVAYVSTTRVNKQGDKNQSSLFDSILKTTRPRDAKERGGDVGGKRGAVS